MDRIHDAEAAEARTGHPRPAGDRAPMVVEVRFASGRIMAGDRSNRRAPEWPLHWGRLFHALVAALHGTGMRGCFDAAEEAVAWIEGIGDPVVLAPPANPITALPTYVPANDRAFVGSGETGIRETCLPDSPWRRKARVFPGVAARTPLVRYAWHVSAAELDHHAPGLDLLLSRVTYVGRSVDFAAVRLFREAPDRLPEAGVLERYVPDPFGPVEMRTAVPGRLAALRALHAAGKDTDPGPKARYSRIGGQDGERHRPPAAAAAPWSEQWLSFALTGGVRAGLTDAEGFAKAVRRELVRRSRLYDRMNASVAGEGRAPLAHDSPVRPFISGHAADGSQHRGDRLAILPLADVLHEHGDGLLLGFALLVPRTAGMGDWEHLSLLVRGFDGPEGNIPPLREIPIGTETVKVVRATADGPYGLTAGRYTRASGGGARNGAETWGTVSPILLGRFPKNRDEVIEHVALACKQSGYPAPLDVAVREQPFFPGIPPARRFTQSPSPKAGTKYSVHAAIRFSQPVTGPVVVGAGRYHGMGLMAPLDGSLDGPLDPLRPGTPHADRG